MDTTLIIGVLGAGILLIAFIGNEVGKMKAETFLYDALNFIGASLLVWYAVLLNSWPFIILEGIWALVALRDIVAKLAEGRKNS